MSEITGPTPAGGWVDSHDDAALHNRIEWNMTNHAPEYESIIGRFEGLRSLAKAYSHGIVDLCPAGEDRDLALRLAEDSLMRAVAAVARGQHLIGPDELGIDYSVSLGRPDDAGPTCTCPPGEEEGSYIPSEDCRVHGVKGAGR